VPAPETQPGTFKFKIRLPEAAPSFPIWFVRKVHSEITGMNSLTSSSRNFCALASSPGVLYPALRCFHPVYVRVIFLPDHGFSVRCSSDLRLDPGLLAWRQLVLSHVPHLYPAAVPFTPVSTQAAMPKGRSGSGSQKISLPSSFTTKTLASSLLLCHV